LSTDVWSHIPCGSSHIPCGTSHIPCSTSHIPCRTSHIPCGTGHIPCASLLLVSFAVFSLRKFQFAEARPSSGRCCDRNVEVNFNVIQHVLSVGICWFATAALICMYVLMHRSGTNKVYKKMLSSGMLCCIVLYSVVQCCDSAVRCCIVLYNAV
jgi:hypothetical protein